MPVILEQAPALCLIRLEGQINLTAAPELKTALLEGIASGKDLELDLNAATEIDVIGLQLLYAVAREAERTGKIIQTRWSEASAAAALASGLTQIREFPFPGPTHE